ncbi:PH domain-containing protein [Massilia sp. ST3]|uniref:PH domain-containing protein n=1 Tax=Massilia sp. ST3 TaxID=2824903 RepID=UPI001B81DB21|nr:PH domain-containing protein [Massilia sp. ST3]MBQ5946493.1 hypothetical protein [Massilia sp. ST3]
MNPIAFDIPAVGLSAYLTLAGITCLAALLPMLLVRKRSLAANLKSGAAAGALVLPVTLLLGLGLSNNTLEVRDGQVRVRASYFYEYARDIGEFDLAQARQGSMASIEAARLGPRDNGISLPGYAAGRFTSADQRPLFVAVTDRERVVYLPAKQGQSLLVSVEQADQLLALLHGRAAAQRQLALRP